MVTIQDFTEGLAAIREPDFTHEGVLDYLRRNPVDLDSLDPYLCFSTDHYTRNLIQKTPLYELLTLCWDPGQKSPIHNHSNQRCWMAIAYGRVQVQNFRVVRRESATHYCELEPTTNFIIDAERPAEVDPEEPIHLVANPSSFGSRAVTLHIYSRPFDTCEVYDFKARRFGEVNLTNTTEFGVLKSDLRVEKAVLVH
ncbi:MAG TPA: cysteine dioxygenase family protein [Terriglobia bacterium]|jgi:cysteine dioxygenase|nr:cysteine dioxygenase family protein [Terriglobia bacterium]